ncbi:MAG: hypothetical protein R3C12_07390 [Planctomycetaceae bacterium]
MKSLQRKVVVGGVVALGVGLAFLLQGLGLQLGTGGRSGNEGSDPTASPVESRPLKADTSPGTPIMPLLATEAPSEEIWPDTSRVLTVIVEEKHYLWGTNTAETVPVKQLDLTEILAKASQAKGDAQGVRVRIYHVGSALPSAENELLAALKGAGLAETEIFFEQRVITLPTN